MIISRNLTKQIPLLLEFFPCIGIIGSRQVGKTTFVKNLQSQVNKPLLDLDSEDIADFEILNTNAQWFLSQNTDKLTVIDEVQRDLKLFPLLRSLIDKQNKPG